MYFATHYHCFFNQLKHDIFKNINQQRVMAIFIPCDSSQRPSANYYNKDLVNIVRICHGSFSITALYGQASWKLV